MAVMPKVCPKCNQLQFGSLVCTKCGQYIAQEEGMKDTERSPELERLANEQAEIIATNFARLVVPKYVAGYKEHGGNLDTKMDLEWFLQEIEKEAVDLFVYVHMARRRLKRVSEQIARLVNHE